MAIFRVALVQLNAGDDVAANPERARDLAERATSSRPSLIALPETFLHRGSLERHLDSASDVPGPLTEPFAALARAHACWVLLGSLVERSADPRRPYNTSVLLSPSGDVAATYRKRHLFDVTVDDGPSDCESARASAGSEDVVALLPGAAEGHDVRLGMTICFDVRFPEQYRALVAAGAQVLAVPADFTERTGRDHWEVLLRARAIENGAFVIAPAQFGRGGHIQTYGHSLVVDPWGTVIAEAGADEEAVLVADLDLDRLASVRRQIPTQPA